MAKWGEDFDTWEPSQEYPSAPPARSAQLGHTPRRPAPLPASSTDANAANFFQEFSQAAEAAGNAGGQQTPDLPYGDNPGIAALIANAQNMLNSDGPDAPQSFGDGFPRGTTPELPEAMRGSAGETESGASRAPLSGRDASGSLSREDSLRASEESGSRSWFPRRSRETSPRNSWGREDTGVARELPESGRGFDSGNGLAYGASLDEGGRPSLRSNPSPARNNPDQVHSEGWQSLLNSWDETPDSLGDTQVFDEPPTLPPAAKSVAPAPPPGASRRTPPAPRPAGNHFPNEAHNLSALDYFGSTLPAEKPLRDDSRLDSTPSKQPVWKSVSAATPEGPTKLRFRRVEAEPGSPNRLTSSGSSDGISPLALIAAAVLLSLIGLGVGVGVGMNLNPSPIPTVTVSPSEPVAEPTGDSPDSVSNQNSASSQDNPASTGGLNGMKVVLDPGHNGGNAAAWQQIGQNVDDGRGGQRPCNTTGTATADGFTEHEFNWNVANLLKTKLEAAGATVIMTRDSDVGVGPCVNDRGAFPQKVGADVMVSIHANGTTNTSVHGFFAMISEPPLNEAQKEPTSRLATALVTALKNGGLSVQSGGNIAEGILKRSDLTTLNFSEVPAVMMELGEMRNPADAALMKSDAGQEKYATSLFNGLKDWAEQMRPPSPASSVNPTESGSPAASATATPSASSGSNAPAGASPAATAN